MAIRYDQIELSSSSFHDKPTIQAKNGSSMVRIDTNYGYIEIGPENTSHCHIQTDLSNFYFNKEIRVNSGAIGSYDEDLDLRRAGSSKITAGENNIYIKEGIRIQESWGQGDYGAEQLSIIGAYPSITLRNNSQGHKWLMHHDGGSRLQFYEGAGWDNTSWTRRFAFRHTGDIEITKTAGSMIATGASSDAFGYNSNYGHYIAGNGGTYVYGNGSIYDGTANRTILHTGNYGSYVYSESESDARFTSKDHFRSTGTGYYTSTTTADLITEALGDGAFNSYLTAHKTGWSYAGNGNLTDAGRLTELAGTSWLWWTDNSIDGQTGNITALCIAPNTGGSANKVFIYNNQGSGYAPGWREVWTNASDGSGSGLDADLLDGYHASNLVRISEPLFAANTSDDTTGPIEFIRSSSYGWDDYIIKHGSSKGMFGKQGVAWHNHTNSSFHVMSSGWTSNFGVNTDGTTVSRTSSRAPLFYDSDNTAYYLDPASTSNLNGITSQGESNFRTKRHYFGLSSNWDSVGVSAQTNVHFQGHNQFWVGAGNGTWFTGTANSKSATSGLSADASVAHDLLITTMQSTSTYDRGITFAVDNAGNGNSGWRLGKWHAGDAYDSSKLTVDGGLFVKGGYTDEFEYYADDYSSYYSSQGGTSYWTGGTNAPSITASTAIQIQAGNNGTNTRNPQLQFHQYGYGGVQFRYEGPSDYFHLEPLGTNRLNWFRVKTNHGYIDIGPANSGYAHIYTDRSNFYMNKTLYISGGSEMNQNDIRAYIYYDKNSTSYYLDPASTSNLNVVQAKSIRNDGSVSSDDSFGIYWNNTADAGYGIYREAGAWSSPYPDLRIAFYTGIKIGAASGYNGTRFYNNSNMATQIASIGDGDNNLRSYYDIIAYASDKRLKTNVEPITNAIDKVKSLQGMTYNWNEVGKEYGWEPSEEREVGVFAQDVQAVLPEAVKLAPFDQDHDTEGNMYSKSGENFLTVKYEKIVPLLIEAIKEQQKQIDELKSLINKS